MNSLTNDISYLFESNPKKIDEINRQCRQYMANEIANKTANSLPPQKEIIPFDLRPAMA